MINAIDLAKLRNAEILQFGTDFSGLIDANDPADLNIVPQYNAFNIKLDETRGLFKLERISPITQELILLDERRDNAINGLTAVILGFIYHFNPSITQAANLLVNNLNIYGPGVGKQNLPSETTTLKAIVKDWETKPDLTAALVTLGLTSWVEELKEANQLFEQKYLERTQEYGAASPEKLKAKREELMETYYELRKFLDANSVLNNTPLYQKTISELNALIDQYNTLLNTRVKEVVVAPVAN